MDSLSSDDAFAALFPALAMFPLHSIVQSEDGPRCGCGRDDCSKPGKHPAFTWSEIGPGEKVRGPNGAAYGIATGERSGVFVVETDSAEAEAWLAARGVPRTLTVRSGSARGNHRYFRHPGFKVWCSAGELAPKVDVKGDGGYVVAPGAPHKSGGRYEIVEDAPVADAPAWLLEWLRDEDERRSARATAQTYPGDVTDPEELAHRRELFVAHCEKAPPSIEGKAGDTQLFHVVQHGALDLRLPAADILEIVREHFDPRCVPPWGDALEERVMHKVRSAKTQSTRPPREPWPADLAHLVNGAAAPSGIATAVRDRNETMPDCEDTDAKSSQLARLVRLVRASGQVLRDRTGEAYFHPAGATAVRLESITFKDLVAGLGRAHGMTLRAATVKDAICNLRGDAVGQPERDVSVRVAGNDRAIYVQIDKDLVATVAPEGWAIESWHGRTDGPAIFVEPSGAAALPTPERGGSVHDLREVLNVDDDAFALVAMWLLAAFRPASAFPILAFCGPKGAAKSSATRYIRSLVDPNVIPHRALPRKERDLVIAAKHARVLAFDNLSGLGNDLSDALCRAATGAGLGTRTLYTNDDESVFRVARPIILNGIDDLGERADLGSRTYLCRLEIPAKRRTDAEVDAAFARVAPRVLGALFDALAVALRNVGTVPALTVRMADAAQWAVAAEAELGFPAGSFRRALEANVEDLEEVAREASPIAATVDVFAESLSEPWEGSASALEERLRDLRASRNMNLHGGDWPKGTSAFARLLWRISTDLRVATVKKISLGRGTGRRNGLQIWRKGEDA